MEYIIFNNDVKMPLVGLGTWELRGTECVNTIEQAIKVGYRLIDTAQMYENEIEVGEGIRQSDVSRSELFVTTKICEQHNSYEKAKHSIDESLKKLQMNYVDLFLVHEPYEQAAEMYRALEEAYEEKKIRAIGISNFGTKHYSSFLKQCKIIPAINQVENHIYFQKWDLQDTMKKNGTAMQAWSPLTQGIEKLSQSQILEVLGVKYQKTAAQIALRFLVQRKISVIPKSRHKKRLIENIDVFDFQLTEEEMGQIKNLDRGTSLFDWTGESR